MPCSLGTQEKGSVPPTSLLVLGKGIVLGEYSQTSPLERAEVPSFTSPISKDSPPSHIHWLSK
jgi:hypothetical protein